MLNGLCGRWATLAVSLLISCEGLSGGLERTLLVVTILGFAERVQCSLHRCGHLSGLWRFLAHNLCVWRTSEGKRKDMTSGIYLPFEKSKGGFLDLLW
jgi:hypothetical protein